MTMHTRVAFDDISKLLGDIPADEHEQRRRLRDCRSMASWMVHQPGGPKRRKLLWMCCDVVTEFYMSGHETEALEKAANFCRDLLLLADKAADLEVSDGLA